jgi:hypothetical protein
VTAAGVCRITALATGRLAAGVAAGRALWPGLECATTAAKAPARAVAPRIEIRVARRSRIRPASRAARARDSK